MAETAVRAGTSPTGGAPWRPLLSGGQATRAMRLADRLVAGLAPPAGPGPADASLSAGSAGIAVCHAVLAAARRDQEAAARAWACLEHAVGAMAAARMTPGLYGGFTGIAWAAELVDRLLGGEGGDRNEQIDAALAVLTSRDLGAGTPYDLIGGVTGLGVYALARWPRASAARCLEGVLAHLGEHACADRYGVYWWTPPSLLAGLARERRPEGGVDLGMAHGVAGVLPLLARAHTLGVRREVAGPLLGGAVRWLLAHMVVAGPGRTVPSFVGPGETPGPSRSAWCYGDPGVAAALLLAAREVGEPAWADAGARLALRAAARPPERTGVRDAGLCHGAAGLAHLFNRMHQLTGEPDLARAAVFWFDRTLSLCEAGPAWNGPGLLEGAAGVALALAAACLPIEPVWDQMLLVSTWPGGQR